MSAVKRPARAIRDWWPGGGRNPPFTRRINRTFFGTRYAEAGVRPGSHLVYRLLVDLVCGHEQVEDLGLPRCQQSFGVYLRQADEGAVGAKRTVGRDGMDAGFQGRQSLLEKSVPGDESVEDRP